MQEQNHNKTSVKNIGDIDQDISGQDDGQTPSTNEPLGCYSIKTQHLELEHHNIDMDDMQHYDDEYVSDGTHRYTRRINTSRDSCCSLRKKSRSTGVQWLIGTRYQERTQFAYCSAPATSLPKLELQAIFLPSVAAQRAAG